MNFYSMKIRLPKEMRNALQRLCLADDAFRAAYQALETHREEFNDSVDDDGDTGSTGEDSVMDWIIAGELLNDKLHATDVDLTNAAQEVAAWWRRVFQEADGSRLK